MAQLDHELLDLIEQYKMAQKRTSLVRKSIFEEASQLMLPQPTMYDFFDYLAGEKLQLPEERGVCDQTTITFKFNAPLPKPTLYKYPKPTPSQHFKPIQLQGVPSGKSQHQT